MEAAQRAAWSLALTARGHAALDAPSWLWESVVDLASGHEAG
jgi:hypothetical protein